jgi:SCP-2 sterol transfer family
LKKSSHAHILNISPPLNLNPRWFEQRVAYTIAKYGMSMCVLGMAEEFKSDRIGVNALWPRSVVYTAALEMLSGAESYPYSRKPDIMADAAYDILCRDPATTSGNFFIDEDVMRSIGVVDMKQYACVPENWQILRADGYLDNVTFGANPSGNVAALFGQIEAILSPDIVAKVNAVYQFNVKGEEAGTWYCDLKNGAGKVGQGEAEKPDATLTMDSKNFQAMFTGKMKPAAAFMTGKLKISGDLQKAMKLEKLMGGLKAKL